MMFQAEHDHAKRLHLEAARQKPLAKGGPFMSQPMRGTFSNRSLKNPHISKTAKRVLLLIYVTSALQILVWTIVAVENNAEKFSWQKAGYQNPAAHLVEKATIANTE